MLPPATIDPYPGLGIVAAVSLHAVFDRLLPTRGLARDNGTDRQANRCTGSGGANVAMVAVVPSVLHLQQQ